jgi:hypothetical protein
MFFYFLNNFLAGTAFGLSMNELFAASMRSICIRFGLTAPSYLVDSSTKFWLIAANLLNYPFNLLKDTKMLRYPAMLNNICTLMVITFVVVEAFDK